ncbi:MAG TPA: class I SAM-dependent methyltransferase [Gaiellales bacterium]
MTQYDDLAEAFERYAQHNAYNAHYDRPAVLGLAGEVAGLRVLDAGCGPGLYAEQLAASGADVVAVDSSERMVRLAQERLGDRAVVQRADLEQPLRFDDGSFDLVVSALVIHYVADRAATLREFHRVLRPGGHVVMSTQHPTADWLRKGGSYFAVQEEVDTWKLGGEAVWEVRFWREPLTSLCAAIADAGFLIERLVEPLPDDAMRSEWPDDWEHLRANPAFIAFRLVRPA